MHNLMDPSPENLSNGIRDQYINGSDEPTQKTTENLIDPLIPETIQTGFGSMDQWIKRISQQNTQHRLIENGAEHGPNEFGIDT